MSFRFLRIVAEGEMQALRATRRLTPSRRRWDPYGPGEVVFLFYEDTIPASYLLHYVDGHLSRGPLHLLRVEFNLLSRKGIREDLSNVEPGVTFVHVGEIVESPDVRIAHLGVFSPSRDL